jgi:hypothetical protein
VALAPAWFWTFLCLTRARRYVVTNAFLRPKKRKRSFFGGLARFARWRAARRRGDGKKDLRYLPGDEPVLWRDTMDTFLDWPHGFRMTVLLVMVPLLLLVVPTVLMSRHGRPSYTLSFYVTMVWVLGAVTVFSRSVGLFAEERANQTLVILLTTPLSGAEIVRQKAKVPWRMTLLLAAPLGTLFVAEAIIEARLQSPGWAFAQLAYVTVSALAVLVLLPTLYWMVLYVGLRIHNRTRAAVVAMGAVFAWNLGPSIVVALLPGYRHGLLDVVSAYVQQACPARLIAIAESGFTDGYSFRYRMPGGFASLAVGFGVNIALMWIIRRACLKNADRYLGRPPVRDAGEEVPAAAAPTEGGAA